VLQVHPNLTPDQVKAVLVGTTQPFGQDSGATLPDPAAGGSGLLDASAAVQGQRVGGSTTLAPANRALRPANTFARSMFRVLYRVPLLWNDPTLPGGSTGSVGAESVAWDSIAWDSVAWDSIAWDSIAWDSIAWDSIAWDSIAWDSVAWDSVAWDSIAWDAFTFD
jgi:serine protease AprX